jgi:hypothetical protein
VLQSAPWPSAIEARFARHGELLVRGLEMTTGYHTDPTCTAETIDADGYYRIVDRKKDRRACTQPTTPQSRPRPSIRVGLIRTVTRRSSGARNG